MIKYLVFLAMLLSTNTLAQEPIQIVLENHNNKLRFYLINISNKSVLIHKGFSLGIKCDAQVSLEIINIKGKKFPLDVMTKRGFLEEEDIYLLEPRRIIGLEFINKNLIYCYSLIPDKYKVRVTYQHVPFVPIDKIEYWAKKGIYSKELISNWVTFEIKEEDMMNKP